MASADVRSGVPVTNYDDLWGAEPRWYSLGGDVSLGRRGVPQLVVFYALVGVVAAAVIHGVPPLSWGFGRVAWWAFGPAVVLLCGAAAIPRFSGVRMHVFLPAAVRHALGPKHFCAWTPCSPSGAAWKPDDLVLVPDGSEGRYRSVSYIGPGQVARIRPGRRTKRGSVETLTEQAGPRMAQPKLVSVPAGRVLRVQAGVKAANS